MQYQTIEQCEKAIADLELIASSQAKKSQEAGKLSRAAIKEADILRSELIEMYKAKIAKK